MLSKLPQREKLIVPHVLFDSGKRLLVFRKRKERFSFCEQPERLLHRKGAIHNEEHVENAA